MRKNTFLGAIAALLFLSGCGSIGLDDVLGGGVGGGSPTTNYGEVRGIVDSVDPGSRSLVLSNVSTGGTGGSTVRIYYDDQTPVSYQGRNYRPEDLERGDEIAARVEQSGNRLYAESMTVLYNSAGSTTGNYGTRLRGTVRSVDTSRRTLEIDSDSYGQSVIVQYDSSTEVTSDGRRSRPEDLRRGDQVEVSGRDLGSGRLLAEDIQILRGTGSIGDYGTSGRSLRGTVRNVDVNRRAIELEQTSSSFISGGGSSVVVYYDTNTGVEYQGRLHPPTNLERGDVVDVQVRQQGNTLMADRIILVRDVNTRY